MPQTGSTQKRAIRKYALLLAGFAVVSVGLLFLSRRYVIDYSEYYPPAYVLFVAAVGVFLLRMRLKDLRREGTLRGIYLTIAERGFAPGFLHLYMMRRRTSRGPMLRLSLLSGIILLFIWLLSANDLLFEENLRILEQCDWIAGEDHEEATPVRRLFVMTEGRGTEERLQLMLKVTKDLSEAGARVVVFELPQAVSRPYYRDLVKQIQSTGRVVFAVQNDTYLRQPITWHSRQFYGPWLAPDTTVRNWGLMTGEFGDPPRTHRSIYFVPDGYIHNRAGGGTDTIPDVTMEILRLWKNYPPKLKPVRAGRDVVFGDSRIPVSPSGLAISPYRFGPGFGFLPFEGVDWKNGRFMYWWDINGEERSADDLREFAGQIQDMIIIVSWSDPVEKNLSQFITGMYPTSLILRDALLGRFVSVRDIVHIPATIVLLLAGLLLIVRTRARVSIPVLALLAVLLFVGAGWLFWKMQILVEVIYPLTGLLLCVLLLPLAKISVAIREEGA
jgi:hypothetical protein